MKTRSLLALVFVGAAAALTLSTQDAHADPTEDARVLFEAGARAYQLGDFRAAIQAFEQAYKAEARPGILFSIAQAHRRQYFVDRRPAHVAVALKYYRDYLALVTQGGRRADAVTALSEVEPLAARLEQEGQLQPVSSVDTADSTTRLMVSSTAPKATIVLDDGAAPRDVPLITEVTPGKHIAKIEAEGFLGERREIQVIPGAVTAIDVVLHEKPARIEVRTVPGAQVLVDGRVVASTPLARPLEIDPGHHAITVIKLGHEPFLEEVDLARGGSHTFTAPLRRTTARKIATGLLGGGAALGLSGIVTGVLALGKESTAREIKDRMDQGTVICRGDTCPDLANYNAAVGARDGLREATGALFGIGVASAGAGALLYFFDDRGTPQKSAQEPAPQKADPARSTPVEISAAPAIGPGILGAMFTGTF
jgi:hypothetical protein